MKITTSAGRYLEQLEVVWNRSGQLVHDVQELGSNLAGLETEAAALAEKAHDYVPQRKRDGMRIIDPSADTSDPREVLAVLKLRLRRTAENLERTSELLKQSRETIFRVVAD